MLRLLRAMWAGLVASVAALAFPAAAEPAANWSGFYVGGAIGFGASNITYFDPAIPTWLLDNDVRGIVGGIRGGYNHQIGGFVLGLEGEFLLSGIRGGVTDTQPGFVGDRFDAEVRWITLLTGRLGYACGPFLFFGRGGVAWARTEHHFQFAQASGFGPTQLDLTRTGWTAGGGVEYAINRQWSATASYSYVDFGRSGNATFLPLPDGFVAQVAQSLHLVMVGVNYRFRQ